MSCTKPISIALVGSPIKSHTSGMSPRPKEVVGKDDLMHFLDASPKQKIAVDVDPQLKEMELIGNWMKIMVDVSLMSLLEHWMNIGK